MKPSRISGVVVVAFASIIGGASASGCADDDDEGCDIVTQRGCPAGRVCEAVIDGAPACFAPVVIRGGVFDLLDGDAVAGARVAAIDINGAAVSTVAVSAADGIYELAVPALRAPDGTPSAFEVTLRADAAGYQTFPSGVRQALPIDLATAVREDGAWAVVSAQTDVGLLEMPPGSGTGSIAGDVEPTADAAGTLVVAEGGSGAYAAIASRDGDYVIFNVPPGAYRVLAYARGVNYGAVELELGGGEQRGDVDLAIADSAPGSVTGKIQIVNGNGNQVTSVVLAVESTFDDRSGRGHTVPGLRDPTPGLPGDVREAYAIEGVPAGRYVVLAAFENDGLVRDPDLSIGNTAVLHIAVDAGADTDVSVFKVTGALDVFGPGSGVAELVSGRPTFRWDDDSSEDHYDVEVFDAYGVLVWQAGMDGVSGRDPEMPYGGPDLMPGMYYQWRATSFKDGVPIARTEDLRGVFIAR